MPGREFTHIAVQLASISGDGGTALKPALSQALGFAQKEPGGMATIIFTDTFVADPEESRQQMAQLQQHGPVALFCVEERIDRDFVAPLLAHRSSGTHVVRISPTKPLVDSALEILT